MTKSTTALLRRIEAEREAARQAAWAERAAPGRKLPRWAVDHLLTTGQIGADLHSAASRYASAIERSQPGAGAGVEKIDGGLADPHARLWDAAVSAENVRAARLWVFRSRTAFRMRMPVLDRLFAFDGHCVTGARPTIAVMRMTATGDRLSYDTAVKRIVGVLDLLDAFWTDRDRGYGR